MPAGESGRASSGPAQRSLDPALACRTRYDLTAARGSFHPGPLAPGYLPPRSRPPGSCLCRFGALQRGELAGGELFAGGELRRRRALAQPGFSDHSIVPFAEQVLEVGATPGELTSRLARHPSRGFGGIAAALGADAQVVQLGVGRVDACAPSPLAQLPPRTPDQARDDLDRWPARCPSQVRGLGGGEKVVD